jgi:2-oxoisovalerate dehydrogenase E1 component
MIITDIPEIYSINSTKREILENWYRLLSVGRIIDEKAPNYLKQAIGWSYHAPYAGHDGIQLAIGQTFEKQKDHIFLYYRDMLSALSCGMSAEEIILNGISRATDPGTGGRHISNHFSKPDM